jgi:hypothetical protein
LPGFPGLLNILKLHNCFCLAIAHWQAFVNMRGKKKKKPTKHALIAYNII